jgi:hypothetical protein
VSRTAVFYLIVAAVVSILLGLFLVWSTVNAQTPMPTAPVLPAPGPLTSPQAAPLEAPCLWTPTGYLGSAYQLLLAAFASPLVIAVLGLIAVNVIVGIAVSLYTKTFHLAETGDWLLTRAMPYILVAGSLQLVVATVPAAYLGDAGGTVGSISGVAIWGIVIVSMLAHLADQARKVGFPIPSWMGSPPAPKATITT